jgi:hypothetical protein
MEGEMNLFPVMIFKNKRENGKSPPFDFTAKKMVYTLSLFLVAAAPGGEDTGGGCTPGGQVKTLQDQVVVERRPTLSAPEEGKGNRSPEPVSPSSPQPQPAAQTPPPKDLPKLAVWDLAARNTPTAHAQELTSILVSEITQIRKYEVYSQENVRTLAGWTEERMKLGCTSTQCLTALGQMDVVRLVSGSVGKIGNTYTVSLNLFDTQNAKAENAVSEFCRSENELIISMQTAVRKLLGVEVRPSRVEERTPAPENKPAPLKKPARALKKY